MIFYQPQNGYCYNSDSIFLYDFIRQSAPKGKVLDVGAGCGVIGLLIAKHFEIELHQVEKQPQMAFFCRKNSVLNRIDATLHVGDFLELRAGNSYDMVVSNPPFWDSQVMQSEDSLINACRYTHHLPFTEMVANVKKMLVFRGSFCFCYDSKQLPEAMTALEAHNLKAEVLQMLHPKADRESSIFFCKAVKGSRSPVRILPPYIPFEGGEYKAEIRELFAQLQTHTIKAEVAEEEIA